MDNKKFWKAVKPLFTEKHFINNKITLRNNIHNNIVKLQKHLRAL